MPPPTERWQPNSVRLRAANAIAKQRAFSASVCRDLERQYGSPHHGNHDDPLDELYYIMLSQMTTGPSYARVFKRLQERCGDWSALARMPLRQLKALIRDAGLSNQKAPRMVAIARRLIADFGVADLTALRSMSPAAAERYLVSLPGVGLKTAKCVAMYSLAHRALPVDTHVLRVSQRLGLLPEKPLSTEAAHTLLERAVAPRNRYSFHVNVLAHGRAVCTSKQVRCAECVLQRVCTSASPRAARQNIGSARVAC
jgi:endonuclease-3